MALLKIEAENLTLFCLVRQHDERQGTKGPFVGYPASVDLVTDASQTRV